MASLLTRVSLMVSKTLLGVSLNAIHHIQGGESASCGRTIDQLSVGDGADSTTSVGHMEVSLFALASGDNQPVHLNDEFAQTTVFGRRVAHGILTAGLISAVIGKKLPGPGSIYLGQTLSFLKPVFIGDIITARVEITKIDLQKCRVTLLTTCINGGGKDVLMGEAQVIPPK